ncbi:SymE family type I addiction module toxin [Chitinophaga barathri]|uniref:Type I toxin-antitoxin system SymE family toxin n=1 Tax=Chitinophaga barathri TaxID=1647451 RepID=A0A3N4M7U9_9BACT|nr:SymE family type I addiction module toxin [Chitinophaga barathri]RPD39441.1 type I toxin-antitoxin system SymE family toxin [Chitinophaga barathri]
MKKERLLTVGSLCYEHEFDNTHVPFIRLSGKWLHEAGFDVGDLIAVEHNKDSLVIRKVEGVQQLEDRPQERRGPANKKVMQNIAKRITETLPVKK